MLNVNLSRDSLQTIGYVIFADESERSKFELDFAAMQLKPNRILVECFFDREFVNDETINFHSFNENNKSTAVFDLKNYDFDFAKKNKGLASEERFKQGYWKVIRFREDKEESNHVTTFESILEALKEDICLDDIAGSLLEKKREKEDN